MNAHIIRPNTAEGWLLGTAATLAGGLVTALVAVTVSTASAVPTQPHDEVGTQVVQGHRITVACTITPLNWNTSLDGPPPLCYRYLR
jgi:hypothetical protein